jgi:serine/threonine protein kinase
MCEETNNYLWATQDILGHGATSQVYKAYNKTTGELVAAKVYQVSSNTRSPYDGQQNYPREKDFRPILDREMDILKAADHENIVRYIALEPVVSSDSTANREALLIEYCNGGSLHNVLELPENRYGLMEDNFMLVFKHLTNALKYLHDKNTVRKIIHFRKELIL